MRKIFFIFVTTLFFVSGYSQTAKLKIDTISANRTTNVYVNSPLKFAVNANEINVKAYGAYGDGTHDDYTAITNAINAANGAEIVFPAGTYKCNTQLSFANVTVRLRGVGSVTMDFSGCSAVAYTFDALNTLKDTTTITTAIAQGDSIIKINTGATRWVTPAVGDVLMLHSTTEWGGGYPKGEYVTVNGIGHDTLFLSRPTYDSYPQATTTVYGLRTLVFEVSNMNFTFNPNVNQYGFYVRYFPKVRFDNVKILNAHYTGVLTWYCYDYKFTRSTISGMQYESVGAVSNSMWGLDVASCQDVVVDASTISARQSVAFGGDFPCRSVTVTNCVTNGAITCHGDCDGFNWSYNYVGDGLYTRGINGTIIGNKIYCSTGGGSLASGINFTVNEAQPATGAGHRASLIIKDNIINISNPSKNPQTYAIYGGAVGARDTINDLIIEGNTFNTWSGIITPPSIIAYQTNLIINYSIKNNYFTTSSSGLLFSLNNYCNITNLDIDNNYYTGGAFFQTSGASSIQKLNVRNNNITFTTTAETYLMYQLSAIKTKRISIENNIFKCTTTVVHLPSIFANTLIYRNNEFTNFTGMQQPQTLASSTTDSAFFNGNSFIGCSGVSSLAKNTFGDILNIHSENGAYILSNSNYLKIPASANLLLDYPSYTIELEYENINVNGTATTNVLFDNNNTPTYSQGTNISVSNNGYGNEEVYASVLSSSSSIYYCVSPTDTVKKHHVVLSVDRTSYMRLYIDGVNVSQTKISTDAGSFDLSTNGTQVGGINTGGTFKIYKLREYNYALSPQEVMQKYNNGNLDYTPNIDYAYYGASTATKTSGTLTAGKYYWIKTFVAGDDFTNIGGTNTTGTYFIAKGTTPTTWSNGSTLMKVGCVVDLRPTSTSAIQWNDLSGNNLNAVVNGTPTIINFNKQYFNYAIADSVTTNQISASNNIATLVNGNNLTFKSGAINNSYLGTFTALSQGVKNWLGMTTSANGNVYADVYGSGDIYMQTAGAGNFNPLSQTLSGWRGMAALGNNVYACVNGGDIYMQTAGAGNFLPLSQATRAWYGMTSANGNVYACTNGGDIYMQTGGVGTFSPLSQTPRVWYAMCANGSNVYACVYGGDIYMQTGGVGTFMPLGQGTQNWTGMTPANGNVYACVYGGDVYVQIGGVGNFTAIGQTVRNYVGMTSLNGNLYACVYGGDIYKATNAVNLSAGNLALSTNTGTGNANNYITLSTGTPTTSGAALQTVTVKLKIGGVGEIIYTPLNTTQTGADSVTATGGIPLVGSATVSNKGAYDLRWNGKVNMTISANPQIDTTNATDGQIITISNTSPTAKTLTLNNGTGLLMAGTLAFTLGQGDAIQFQCIKINNKRYWRENWRVDVTP